MNAINPIAGINEMLFYNTDPVKPVSKTGLFQSFFNAALQMVNETNESQLLSEQLYVDLATGKTDDILAVVMAQNKADAALNFTVQVTGKIIEAYREIMRIQL